MPDALINPAEASGRARPTRSWKWPLPAPGRRSEQSASRLRGPPRFNGGVRRHHAAALPEIDAFFRKSGKVVIPLTVREILEEEIARKLA